MACVALTSLMATIQLEFMRPDPRFPLDDEGYILIMSLYDELYSLQGFVQHKSEAGGDTAIRELVIQIRDFALDAEDRIETQLSNFLLAIKNPEDQQKAYQQQLLQTLGEAAQNAAKLMEKSKETDDKEVMNISLHIINPEKVVVNISGGPVIPWLKHDSASEPSNVIMVGRRGDHLEITHKLIKGSKELQVVSIVGMAGIGKTTLVSSVYQDPEVASHFDVRRWVSIPRAGRHNIINVSQVLHTLLWTLAEADDEINKGSIPDDDNLIVVEQVYKRLKAVLSAPYHFCKVFSRRPTGQWNLFRDQNQGSDMHYRRRRVYTFR